MWLLCIIKHLRIERDIDIFALKYNLDWTVTPDSVLLQLWLTKIVFEWRYAFVTYPVQYLAYCGVVKLVFDDRETTQRLLPNSVHYVLATK